MDFGEHVAILAFGRRHDDSARPGRMGSVLKQVRKYATDQVGIPPHRRLRMNQTDLVPHLWMG